MILPSQENFKHVDDSTYCERSKFRSFNFLVVKQKIILVKNKNYHLPQL